MSRGLGDVYKRQQFERLKELYVDTIVDSMSTKDLYEYVANDTYNYMDKLSEFEVYEEIKYTLDDEMLDEFVKQIKEESKEQMYYKEDKERD